MNTPTDEAIRMRAYAIWQNAGQPEGYDVEHWQQAETELRTENSGIADISGPEEGSIRTGFPDDAVTNPDDADDEIIAANDVDSSDESDEAAASAAKLRSDMIAPRADKRSGTRQRA